MEAPGKQIRLDHSRNSFRSRPRRLGARRVAAQVTSEMVTCSLVTSGGQAYDPQKFEAFRPGTPTPRPYACQSWAARRLLRMGP
jgi:hypothetical protein